MSTKTTFKRIALVAVAALGLGVLTVAPSQATPISTTVTAGTAGATSLLTSTTVSSDTTTGTSVSVTTLFQGTTETSAVTFVQKSAPAGSTVAARMIFIDTNGSTTARVSKNATSGSAATALSQAESETAGGNFYISNTGGAGYAGASFSISLESATATAKTGTYVYTVVVTNFTGATQSVTQYTADVSIVVAASADLSKTPVAAQGFANLSATSISAGAGSRTAADATPSILATAGTAAGYIFVANRNSVGGYTTAEDSLTAVVTGAGVVCNSAGTTCGKSLSKLAVTGDYQFILQADGTAGASTVTITSGVTGATFTKSLTYYAKDAKTITPTALTPVLGLGANDSAVAVTAVDSNGTNWTGALYIAAATADDALIGGSATTAVACVAKSDKSVQWCPITTKATGTAKFIVMNKSDVTLATVKSDAISVTVSSALPATVKLAFDKTTYAPGEKAIVSVTPLDASGNKIAAVSSVALLASAITSNVALTIAGTGTAEVLSKGNGAAVTTSAYSSSSSDIAAGAYQIVVYMPLSSGTVTLTSKGGTYLPLAGQVTVTASADVVNASVDAATDAANEATDAANAATDAALAAADAADAATAAAQDASDAVAALSATVAKLVASLKAQITSLTNLVIKIQKKVRA